MAKVFIKDLKEELYLHYIKNCIVFKWGDLFGIVNKDTLIFDFYETEEEAVNFILEFYKFMDSGKQTELF